MALFPRPHRTSKSIESSQPKPWLALQDHPQLNFLPRSSWPPIWVHTRSQPYKRLIGKVGMFTGTILTKEIPKGLYVKMEFEQDCYLGLLMVQDAVFARQLHGFLQSYIGLSIKEVGDLDLSEML